MKAALASNRAVQSASEEQFFIETCFGLPSFFLSLQETDLRQVKQVFACKARRNAIAKLIEGSLLGAVP